MRYLLAFFLSFNLLSAQAQTFTDTVNVVIPDDGSTVYHEIEVVGLPLSMDTAFGIELVCLNILHPYVEDMTVRLEAPNGQSIVLFAGVGGNGANFIQTCLAGEGLGITQGEAPFTGTFQSYGILGNLNRGLNPNGTWKLVIQDTYPMADEGFLENWSITFSDKPARPFEYVSSDLPIVKLTTVDAPIGDDPKVPVLMQIIDNGAGNRNYLNQTNFAYEGLIMAEWQGFTGPYYPKKNYDFELVDAQGNELDSTILGMPRESDWIFKAEYLDLTLIKNTLSYEMARRMGGYAPRTAPCEIVLDGEYIGLFFLTEKIKRDANRVDIAKLNPTDISGSELTGGYIFEMNINNNTPADWISEFLPINYLTSQSNVEFKYVYPKRSAIVPQQADYIQNYVSGFENVLDGPDFTNRQTGYRKWIDVGSFIDFLIVNEFSMNYDSYGRSTYLYKEKDTDGGLLKIGPPWDYDRALDYFRPELYQDWVWEKTHEGWPFPFWWSKMWTDPSYRQQLACRWEGLRQNTLSTDAFVLLVDSLTNRLDESQKRNFTVWNDLRSLSYTEHVAELKTLLEIRLEWMDSTLSKEIPSGAFRSEQSGANAGNWFFTANDTTAASYLWDFGDGNTSTLRHPEHQYLEGGMYLVRLTVRYGTDCSTTSEQQLNFTYVDAKDLQELRPEIAPNPFSNRLFVKNVPENALFTLNNSLGQVVFEGKNIQNHVFSDLNSGVYWLKISSSPGKLWKLVKE